MCLLNKGADDKKIDANQFFMGLELSRKVSRVDTLKRDSDRYVSLEFHKAVRLNVRSTKGRVRAKSQCKQNGPKRVTAADYTFIYSIYCLSQQ